MNQKQSIIAAKKIEFNDNSIKKQLSISAKELEITVQMDNYIIDNLEIVKEMSFGQDKINVKEITDQSFANLENDILREIIEQEELEISQNKLKSVNM